MQIWNKAARVILSTYSWDKHCFEISVSYAGLQDIRRDSRLTFAQSVNEAEVFNKFSTQQVKFHEKHWTHMNTSSLHENSTFVANIGRLQWKEIYIFSQIGRCEINDPISLTVSLGHLHTVWLSPILSFPTSAQVSKIIFYYLLS